jgi:hypothetical protein
MNEVIERITLTAPQRRFADEHRTSAGIYGADHSTVCLYRERPDETIRWIVDRRGRLLEKTAFKRAGSASD